MATKNTTSSLGKPKFNDKELQEQVNKAAAIFKDEKKVKVSIPKHFLKYMGPTLPIGVNGSFVVLPVDGSEVEINETHANHLRKFLATYK